MRSGPNRLTEPYCVDDNVADFIVYGISLAWCSAVMEMNVLADTSDAMPAAQQQLFFKEASDASYRARSNLTPDQQVQYRWVELHTS